MVAKNLQAAFKKRHEYPENVRTVLDRYLSLTLNLAISQTLRSSVHANKIDES